MGVRRKGRDMRRLAFMLPGGTPLRFSSNGVRRVLISDLSVQAIAWSLDGDTFGVAARGGSPGQATCQVGVVVCVQGKPVFA